MSCSGRYWFMCECFSYVSVVWIDCVHHSACTFYGHSILNDELMLKIMTSFFLFTVLCLKRNRNGDIVLRMRKWEARKMTPPQAPKLHLPFFFSLYFLLHWIGRQMLCDQPWHVIILFLVCLMSHYPDAPSQSRWYCLQICRKLPFSNTSGNHCRAAFIYLFTYFGKESYVTE